MADHSIITRRGVLKAVPAIPAVVGACAALPLAASPRPALMAAEDPHPEWLREWRRAEAEYNRLAGDVDEAKREAIWERHTRLEDLICHTEARTVPGALAQIDLAIDFFEPLMTRFGRKDALMSAAAVLRRLG